MTRSQRLNCVMQILLDDDPQTNGPKLQSHPGSAVPHLPHLFTLTLLVIFTAKVESLSSLLVRDTWCTYTDGQYYHTQDFNIYICYYKMQTATLKRLSRWHVCVYGASHFDSSLRHICPNDKKLGHIIEFHISHRTET